MTPNAPSLLSRIRQYGPDDRVFDALLAAGPVVVVVLALVGRNPVTLALAGCYLLTLVARTAQNALTVDSE